MTSDTAICPTARSPDRCISVGCTELRRFIDLEGRVIRSEVILRVGSECLNEPVVQRTVVDRVALLGRKELSSLRKKARSISGPGSVEVR